MNKSFITLLAALIISSVTFAQYRPYDKRGINIFEKEKTAPKPYEGVKLNIGGSFTQSYQSLTHSNTADPKMVGTPAVDQNKIVAIVPGFNTANANLYLMYNLEKGHLKMISTYNQDITMKHGLKVGIFNLAKFPFLKRIS